MTLFWAAGTEFCCIIIRLGCCDVIEGCCDIMLIKLLLLCGCDIIPMKLFCWGDAMFICDVIKFDGCDVIIPPNKSAFDCCWGVDCGCWGDDRDAKGSKVVGSGCLVTDVVLDVNWPKSAKSSTGCWVGAAPRQEISNLLFLTSL